MAATEENKIKQDASTSNLPGLDQQSENVNKKKKKKRRKSNASNRNNTEISNNNSVPKEKASVNSQPDTVDLTKEKENKKSVYIVGDSIIKGLKWWKMARGDTKVHMKCFPGATVEDMESYALPTVRKNPDEIIVHIGTNDLRNCTPRQVADSIVNLTENISQNSNARVTISGIVPRSDDDALNSKVTESNKILKTFAGNRSWSFIDNSRINSSLLSKSGLHLNEKGNAALAKNIMNYLYSA